MSISLHTIRQWLHSLFYNTSNRGNKPYTNEPISILDQLKQLQADGLVIDDMVSAEVELSNISYFRLSEYLNHLRLSDHTFRAGSTLDEALQSYYFDKNLRALIFQAIQSIEIALRTRMIQHISMTLGTFWFLDKKNFRTQKYYLNTLKRIKYEVGRSKESFIREFFAQYSSPELPPVWKTLEVISFGTLSKLYENLMDGTIKQSIATSFNMSKYTFFESWIQSIAVLRNLCCHHNRVWNRNFSVHPQMPTRDMRKLVNIPNASSPKLYNFLCVLCYLEKQIHPTTAFAQLLKDLLSKYPQVEIAAMGFPTDWQSEPLWQ